MKELILSFIITFVIFMAIENYALIEINQKLDELIKLNTPEIIHIVPDQII